MWEFRMKIIGAMADGGYDFDVAVVTFITSVMTVKWNHIELVSESDTVVLWYDDSTKVITLQSSVPDRFRSKE